MEVRTADNGRFASVGGDKTAFVWDVTTGKTIRKFTGHNSRINTCAWNNDFSVLTTFFKMVSFLLYDILEDLMIALLNFGIADRIQIYILKNLKILKTVFQN